MNGSDIIRGLDRIPTVVCPFDERNIKGERVCVWCGGPLPPRKRRWCGDKCVGEYIAWKGWGFRIGVLAHNIDDGQYTCVVCGFKSISDSDFDVDHIVAICLGGDPADTLNGQVLCHRCHKKKTKKDVRELSTGKKLDAMKKSGGFTTLESFG